jgi:NhaP-type Na+/H+ or K+/H+ antiporter
MVVALNTLELIHFEGSAREGTVTGFGNDYTHLLAALCGFLILVAIIRHYAPGTVMPAESWLLLAGIGYGLVAPLAAALPDVRLDPEVVLSLLVPVLVFSEGRHLPIALLVRSAGPVLLLVLLSIPLGILLIGLPSAWLVEIPYLHGVLFGAAVAATDPASVGHILNRFPLPARLKLLLHGESIFNDAITIVLFTALATIVIYQTDFLLSGLAVETVRGMLLAVPVGLLLGWLAGLTVRHWHEQNRFPGLTLTLALPIAAFLLSERLLHASGIIAVLFAALAFSHTRRERKLGERELYDEFWEYLGNLGASALFFALGAAMAPQVFALHWSLGLIILLLLLSRTLLIYGSGPLLRLQGCSLPRSWRHILMLGGLRGAVPAALVLMLPLDYAYRDELLVLVFSLVAYSMLVHPLLLQWYLRRYPVSELPQAAAPTSTAPGEVMTGVSPTLAHRLESSAWGLAAIAGVVAGVVFLILEMIMIPLFLGMGPWVPVRMIAAIGLGPEVLPPPATFAVDMALAAMVVHFTLSLVYAWLLAPLIENTGLLKGVLLGALFGLAIYLVNFYFFTAMFPWFTEARNWITIFAHLVFGAVLAGTYLLLRRSR